MSAPVVFLQGHSLVCIPIFLYRYLSYCIGAYLITLLQIDHSFFQFVTFPPHTHTVCKHVFMETTSAIYLSFLFVLFETRSLTEPASGGWLSIFLSLSTQG